MKPNLNIVSIDSNRGLPSDQVHIIVQDEQNRIWMAGPAGLSRYDGNQIHVFDNQNGLQCQGLRTAEINNCIVWIGTDRGLETIYSNGKATEIQLEEEWIYGLVERIKVVGSSVWLGTSYGLLKLEFNDQDNIAKVTFSAELGFVRDLIILDNNCVIAATVAGLIFCDGTTYKNLLHNDIPKKSVILCLHKCSDNRILVGTDLGLFIIDQSGEKINHIIPEGDTQKINAISISGSEWWLAAGANVLLYEEKNTGVEYINSYLIGSSVNSIFIDAVNNVWIGSNSGGAKKISCLRKVFSKIETGAEGAVYSIKKDNNNSLRIGGETYFSTILNAEYSLAELSQMTIWDSCEDPVDKTKIWLATQEGLFYIKEGIVEQFGKNDTVLKSPARCLQPRGDDLFVGTLNGLARINGSIIEQLLGDENINLGYIYSLELDNNQTFWIGTLGSGLWHETDLGIKQITGQYLLPQANNYAALPNKNGAVIIIQDEQVILLDESGNERLILKEYPVAGWSVSWIDDLHVLVGSNEGLLLIDLNENKIIKRINPLLGKGGWQFTNNKALLVESEEKVYCGLNVGLYALNLKGISAFSQPPELNVDEILWENADPKLIGDVMHLKSGKWSMETAVYSAWFIDEDLIRFRFKLIGFDKEWTALQKGSKIKYTSLPPGKYELKGQLYTSLTGFGNPTTLFTLQVDSVWKKLGLFKTVEWLQDSFDHHFLSSIKNKKLIERNQELVNEIKQRKKAEKNIKISEEKYRTLVEQASDGIIIISPEGRILTVNKSACLISLFNQEELLQMSITDFTVMEDLAKKPFRIKDLKNGKAIRTERPMKRRDGVILMLEINAKLLFNGNLLVFIRDITERKENEKELELHRFHLETIVEERTLALNTKTNELEINQTKLLNIVDDLNRKSEELAKAKIQAETADKLKSAFLSTMSHELRTPLNSILGFTVIMLKEYPGPINAEQSNQLGMIKASGEHLLILINEILDLSKIEAGQLVVVKEYFSLKDSITKVSNMVTPQIAKKNLKLNLYITPDLTEITGDQQRVEQVLINLLNNAIKFTEEGDITLSTELVFVDQKSNYNKKSIRITITDTGIGIKPENISELFKPFNQIDSKLSRAYEGTGLGLAICMRLIELMGGTIKAESVFGKGSSFSFTIPIN